MNSTQVKQNEVKVPTGSRAPWVLAQKKAPKILVVDDQPINIKLLQRKLERQGMDVTVAYNGKEALKLVEQFVPDLILLDIMMPEMDGIETCNHLKSNPQTETIPIIFITAKASKEGKLEGLEAGAVDYITKPIDLDETLARVNTQLRLQEMFKENLELQRRLGESRRSAAVGAITQGIAHNLNNLLGVVVGYLDLIKAGSNSPEMVQRSVGLMDSAIQRMVHIIRQLSSIARNDRLELKPINLRDLILASITRFKTDFHIETDVKINSTVPADFKLSANLEVFESVFASILINAWESYGEDHKGVRPIEVVTEIINENHQRVLMIYVYDEGAGLAPEVGETMFEPFITTKTSVGRGMGLTIARHALRNLGADIYVATRKTRGVEAQIRYPLN
jgi:two-component system sensor histidine kinase/response regulator